MIRRWLLVNVIILSSCTGGPGRGRTENLTSPTSPSPTASASLTVTEHQESGRTFTEGSISYLVVRQADRIVVRKTSENAPAYRPLLDDLPLEPGNYQLISYRRPCDGSCEALDPPVARCSRHVQLEAGQRIVVDIEVRVPNRCTMGVASAAEVGVAYPFRVLTHCGIQNILFNGRIWIPSARVSRKPNPPLHWGNPYEEGDVRLTSSRSLEFTAASGGTVRFELPPPGAAVSISGCY